MILLKRKILVIVIMAFWSLPNLYSQQLFSSNSNDFIRYIKLPPGITKSDILLGSEVTRTALHNYTKSVLSVSPVNSLTRQLDLVVVFTEQDGTPILPDLENRNNQARGINRNNNDLTFTFNSPDQPWTISEINTLNTFVTDLYPVTKNVIGNPLFNITVNVRQDSNLINYAGYYISTINEMVLWKLQDHVFCHESIHAFRDDYIMGLSTYEEGMTRESEVEVFNQLSNYTHNNGDFHSYTYDIYYEGLNSPEIATYQGNLFTNITHTFLKYQLASYIWAKAYLEDYNFLKRFNDSIYSQMLYDPNTIYSESKLRNIFAAIKPTVEGLSNAMWYDRQFLLNSTPTQGYKLYQRLNQFTIDYFYRDASNENPQGAATVFWKLLDQNDQYIDAGNDVTTSYGWINYYHNFVGNYGKIKLIANVQSPIGLITDTVIRVQPSLEQGVFGVVEDTNTGYVSITPLDTAMATVTINLTNGAFSFPTLENVRGKFLYVFTYPNNQIVSRIFTKDRSKYFLLVKNDTKTYWVGAVSNSWHNPLNWSGGLVPGEYSNVIINSANPYNCIIDAPAICRSLELSNNIVLSTNNNLIILN